MEHKLRKEAVVLAAALLSLPTGAQRDKNYYTQIVRLADGSEVRLLPDDIARVSVIKDNDWPQMTIDEYLTFNKAAELDSVKQWWHYDNLYNNEDFKDTICIPSSEAWRKATAAMKPYYQWAPTLCGADFNNTTYINQIKSFNYSLGEYAAMHEKLLHLAPDAFGPEAIVSRQQVLNGEVTVVNNVPENYWKHDLTLDNWEDHYKMALQGSYHYGAPDTVYYFDNIKDLIRPSGGNISALQHVNGTSFITVSPYGSYNKPEILIRLPQPLSATYDFYCVIAPENADFDTVSVARPNILNFRLYYGNESGELQSYNFSADGTDNPKTQNINTAFTNDTTKVDSLYLGRFTFPVAYDGLPAEMAPALYINCPISVFNKTQMAEYTRTVRLSAIVMRLVREEQDNN